MARNAEKAQAMLNRWYRMKRNLYYPDEKEMPKGRTKIQQVMSLNECDTWRTSILRDISKKISEVQNAGLGEHAIRELNDEINHLIKDKNKWEERIKELGGPDYKKLSVKLYDSQGFELPGTAGYKYFGASKDLPGVRELFQRDVPYEPRKSRADIYRHISHQYYGFNLHEMDDMVKEEQQYEKKCREQELERFIKENAEFIKTYFKGTNPTEQQLVDALDKDLDDFLQNYEEEEKEKLEMLKMKEQQDLEEQKEREFVEQKKKDLVKMSTVYFMQKMKPKAKYKRRAMNR